MPIRSVRDIEIHYELHGDRGPAVLLIHGLGSSLRDWERQVETLAPRYRVLTADLRGHGQSTRKGPITMADFAADLRALLAALDIASVHVVGISLGASIAFQIALDFPDVVDGLVIINGGPDGPRPTTPSTWPSSGGGFRPCASKACGASAECSRSACCQRRNRRPTAKCSSSAGPRTIPRCTSRAWPRLRTGQRAIGSAR
jgi:pimeloyl-ACP methyl ester carboxylesterase